MIASFESRGLYAYDMNGTLLWQNDLGDKTMRNQFGEGSTPALHGNTLVVVWDHTGRSFITALDERTGKEIWRQKRDEIDTWATPLVLDRAGRAQVIVPAMNRIRSYDLETGAVVWHTAGLTMNPIPSPVADDGLVYPDERLPRQQPEGDQVRRRERRHHGHRRDRLDARSRHAVCAVAAAVRRHPLLSQVEHRHPVGVRRADGQAALPAAAAAAGAPDVFASPVGAAGRVYIPSRDGATIVLKHGPTFEVIAENKLSDGFDASPALADREIYLRGQKYLYCIAE